MRTYESLTEERVFQSTPSVLQSLSPFVSISPEGGLHITKAVPVDTDRFHALLIARSGDVSISKCVELKMRHEARPPSFGKKLTSLKLNRNTPLGMQLMKVRPPRVSY